MPPLAFLEVNMIRVMVNGAGGKMGREVVKAVHADSELTMSWWHRSDLKQVKMWAL